ncbi:hypothetical protein [Nocardia sp. NPDC047648]|uniref:nSTAND1 domain-containing NTPase n=1 Tax=Nocardia sp. NPDC047648 TaxID=3155625 RepID=UPI0033EA70ED
MFAVVGPSGTGKSFLRAGLLPRLMREDRQFLVLGLVRTEKHALPGAAHGLAAAIHATRARLGLTTPALGDIKAAFPGDIARIRDRLLEMQHAARGRQLDDGAAPAARADEHAPLTIETQLVDRLSAVRAERDAATAAPTASWHPAPYARPEPGRP